MKIKKGFIILIICLLPCWYWTIVISIKIELQEKGNKYGYRAFIYKCTDERKYDSLLVLFYHYSERANNTLKLIPKFTRP